MASIISVGGTGNGWFSGDSVVVVNGISSETGSCDGVGSFEELDSSCVVVSSSTDSVVGGGVVKNEGSEDTVLVLAIW